MELAAAPSAVGDGTEEHAAAVHPLAVGYDPDLVEARREDGAEDTHIVGILRIPGLNHVIGDGGHHGIEAHVDQVDGVAVVDFHGIDLPLFTRNDLLYGVEIPAGKALDEVVGGSSCKDGQSLAFGSDHA